jgi:Fic family protein
MFKPKYTITEDILNKIAQIEKMRGQVEDSFILPEREVSLRHRAAVEATSSSTAIENNPLSRQEVEAVLANQEIARAKRHIDEVKNYKQALDYIETRKATKTPITTTDILKLHKLTTRGLLSTEQSGRFRTGPVYVVRQTAFAPPEVLYTAPPADRVAVLVDRLLAWLELVDQVHPLIAAAVLHIEFVDIHPFADGNGRLARLLTLLYLGLQDFDFRGVLVPENYYIADRPLYYQKIRSAQGKAYNLRNFPDLTEWAEYFIGGIVFSALEVVEAITLIETPLATRYTKRLSRDELEILRYVKQFGSIKIETASELLPKANRRTIQRRLKSLVDGGQLKVEGEGRATQYLWQDQP